jgi:hypothetical protein
MPTVDGVNYPGPYEIRMNYSAPAGGFPLISQIRVNVDVDTPPDPGSPFADYDLISRAGLFYNAQTFTDAWATVLAGVMRTDANFSTAELWKYSPGSFNADFQSGYNVGQAGLNAGTAQTTISAIITMRTQNGGHLRCQLNHMVSGASTTDPYPFAITEYNDIADFYSALSSPILGRDGGYVFAPMNLLVGQNEFIFKKYFRP